MSKEDVIHVYNGIVLSHKNNEIIQLITAWIDLEITIISEINQRKTNI